MDEPGGGAFLAGTLALGLALVHLFAGRLRFLDVTPRSIWLSMSGGASVSYVFVHLLPELAAAQEDFEAAALEWIEPAAEVYLVALTGLALFYGLERAAVTSRGERRDAGEADHASPGVFWLHVVSFAVYNLLIGYLLLHREEAGRASLLLFALAMGLHFLVNDYGLRHHHRHIYDHTGRWILAAAVLLGWAAGLFLEINELHLALVFAFIAGGVVLNVLKEELPAERESRFWAFAAGAAGYALLLLLV
jgi:Mg2+/citrate symporter